MKRQIFRNIASNYAGKSVGSALGFFLVPFLIHKFGVQTFGIIAIAESCMYLIETVSSSLRTALARHATFALSRGDREDFVSYLSTGRFIFLLLAVLVIFAGLFVSFHVDSLFRIPEGQVFQTKVMFVMMSVAFAISIPNVVYWTVLYTAQRLDLINLASSTGLIVRAVSIFVLFSVLPSKWISLGLYGVIFLAMMYAENMFIYFAHRRVMPGIRIEPGKFRTKQIGHIFSFGAYNTLNNMSGVLYGNAVHFIINRFWGPGANALYAVSAKLPSLLSRFFVEPSWALMPTFTQLAARGENSKIKEIFFSYSKGVALVSFPICALILVWSDLFIRYWVGPGFEGASVLMQVQVAQLFVVLPLAAASGINQAHGRIRLPSIVSALSAAVKVLLGLLLGLVCGMGLTGMALGATLVSVVLNPGFFLVYACRSQKISVLSFWRETFIGPALLLLGLLAAGAAVWGILGAHLPLAAPAGLSLLLTCAFYAGAYACILSRNERAVFNELTKFKLFRKPA